MLCFKVIIIYHNSAPIEFVEREREREREREWGRDQLVNYVDLGS